MIRYGTITAAILVGGLLAGCNQAGPGTTRTLGAVGYAPAFAAAREAFAQHFSVASAEPAAGEIRGRPKLIEARGERLLGGSPARQVATLRLRREKNIVVANLAIAIQRQGSAVHRQMRAASENYSTVPNQTPAELDAATSAEQNEVWRTERYDHALARRILEQIYLSLHPKAAEP